jgi:hypothetical protein
MHSLILSCSDGDLADSLSSFTQRHRFVGADRMFVPGGPLVLTRPGMERRVALGCMQMLVEEKEVRRIALVSHESCVAYEKALGGLGLDQPEILERDLRRVRTLIENEFPGVDVSTWLIPRVEAIEGPAWGEARRVE